MMPIASQDISTQNPAGDLNAELQNLIGWSDETRNLQISYTCTHAFTTCLPPRTD